VKKWLSWVIVLTIIVFILWRMDSSFDEGIIRRGNYIYSQANSHHQTVIEMIRLRPSSATYWVPQLDKYRVFLEEREKYAPSKSDLADFYRRTFGWGWGVPDSFDNQALLRKVEGWRYIQIPAEFAK